MSETCWKLYYVSWAWLVSLCMLLEWLIWSHLEYWGKGIITSEYKLMLMEIGQEVLQLKNLILVVASSFKEV